MFTSGSTGEPKAIAIPHRAVVRLVRGSSYVRFDRQQVFLLLAPLTFDASTFEIWGALLNGAKLIVHPEPLPTVRGLERVIRAEGVTTLWLTAGLFHQFVEDRVEALAPVRQLLAGGDVVQAAPVKKLLRQSGQRTFVNGYGPTENTTFSCCHAVSEAADLGAVVPIGTAISNTTTYVLDESLQPTPIGVPGELFVGGDGLARGYWARPDLTAARFLPDPFAKQSGARMYRTGDLVRMRPDGQFEFLGRTDRQIKVRGYRIEPGEIESVMAELDEVKAAAVVVDDIPGRGRQLVAFWVPEGPEPSLDSLRLCLEELLPSYLMPAKLVALDELPLTRNGKVAYEKLLALENEQSSSQVRHQTAGTETEKAVARIWCEVLEREEFDLNENFFDVGGQSLLLIRVHERLEAWAGRQLPLVDLFQYTTIRSLSSYLDGASEDQLTGDVERRHEGSQRRSQLRARRRSPSSDQHD
jgi:acyl-coenzyme A synthetase/AMP-(fatty) acid ligase/acyl carrier protein